MSQTPLLSIVAAVYNGEKFLAQFFECLEQQQLESYELILVNDGSTDNSLAVIAEWRDRLQNVQVLEQENQGVSVARNTGLAAASGKYLAFPDIDDKLYPGMYRTLLEMAEKEHLDIATCNGTYVYEKRRESHPIFPLDRSALDRRAAGSCLAQAGPGLAEVSTRHLAQHLSPRLYPPASLPFRTRPAPSGYPVDDRGAAGRGARAVHQPAVL